MNNNNILILYFYILSSTIVLVSSVVVNSPMREPPGLLLVRLLLLLVCPARAAPHAHAVPTRGFVSRRGTRLFVDGGDGLVPYRAAGVNAYWLGLDENVDGVHFPTRWRITDALSTVAGWLGPRCSPLE